MSNTEYGALIGIGAARNDTAKVSELPTLFNTAGGMAQIGNGIVVGDGYKKAWLNQIDGFSPRSLSGLQLWLDASQPVYDANGAAVAQGGAVTYWPDLSGNNHLMTVSGTPTRGVSANGLPAIMLDGSGQGFTSDTYLSATDTNSGFTWFVVAELSDSATGTRVPLNTATGPHYISVDGSTGNSAGNLAGATGFTPSANRGSKSGVFFLGYNGVTAGGNVGVFGQNQAISALKSSNILVQSSDNGIQKTIGGTVTAFSSSALRIGIFTGSHWNGAICEVMHFNRLLTDAEIRKVQGWLCAKWGYDKELVICAGDSLTSGQNSTGGATQSQVTGTTNYPNRLKALLGGEFAAAVRTDAVPGQTIQTRLTTAVDSRLSSTLYNPYSTKRQRALVWMGTNDIALNGTLDPSQYFKQLCLDHLHLGYEVFAFTMVPRKSTDCVFPLGASNAIKQAAFEVARQKFNNWLRANYGDFANKLIDLDTITQLSDPTNTTYYNADGTHLTDAAYQLIANYVYSQW